MTPVSCVPKDDFHVVLRCDGTGAILPTPCGYTKKIGTTFGDELSETISISSTIGKTGLKEYIQSLFYSEKCDPMGPRDECMKVNFNTMDTDKDMCLKKGCCFFAPKRSTDPWCYFAKDGK